MVEDVLKMAPVLLGSGFVPLMSYLILVCPPSSLHELN